MMANGTRVADTSMSVVDTIPNQYEHWLESFQELTNQFQKALLARQLRNLKNPRLIIVAISKVFFPM